MNAPPAEVNFAKVTWAMEQAARILQGEGLLPEYQFILDNYLADAIKRRDQPH